MSFMSKKLKVKFALLAGVVVLSLIIMGVILSTMQDDISLNNYRADIQREMDELPVLLETAHDEAIQNEETFDAIYQSKAASVAFMANNNTGYKATDAKMREYKDMLLVDNAMFVSRDGKVLAKAQDTPVDFSYARYNELRSVFDTGEPSAAVEVTFAEQNQTWRYYSVRIDDNTMVVIEQNPAELTELYDNTSSISAVFSSVRVGQTGYVFAISGKDYVVSYHPNAELIGSDALSDGMNVSNLENGTFTWLTFNGERLYCGVSEIEGTYYVSAVPESELIASRNLTVGVILFIFFSVAAIVALYGIFVMREDEKRGYNPENFKTIGPLRYNKAVGRKAIILSFVGFLLVAVVTFYMQALFSLSAESVSSTERSSDIQQTINDTNEQAKQLTDQYNERYLNKAEVAAYILDKNPDLKTKEDLQKLADTLQVQYLYVFDGFVQLGIRSDRLETLLASVQLDSILDGVKIGQNGFAFAVNANDKTFSYYPDDQLIGSSALSHGMTDKQLQPGFNDFITIDGVSYYASSFESNGNYIYVAQPENELMTERVPITVTTALCGLLCQIVIFMLVAFELKRTREGREDIPTAPEDDGDPDSRTFDTVLPDGRVTKTESATSRWLYQSLEWEDKTPEQRVLVVIKALMAIFAVVVCLGVVFKDAVFPDDSAFAYVLNGGWEYGLNVLALTAAIMIICVVSTITVIIQKLLHMLAGVFGARGETMCRLLSSFIKYATIIGMVYYCLMLIGIDTTTLLASAGILSIAITFGAKELVSDILSGLFIIFEGEFRVGDVIQVGSHSGTVMEIGVRTTKINDGSGNVIIIRNSEVSNVTNMTKESSYASVDLDIEYGESLERVENILKDEFPTIRRRLPSIEDGPFYKGVVSLEDNSVTIRVVAKCDEGDRVQLGRDLLREMKLIFDEHEIKIPYSQVVVHQPSEYKKATIREQLRADKFNDDQKVAARDVGNEASKK